MNKISEYRKLSHDEIGKKILYKKETLFNLRFQHEIGQLENPKKLQVVKREIAKLKTILNENKTQ